MYYPFVVPHKCSTFVPGLSVCTYAMQSYLILGRQRSPFLFICIAGCFFPLCRTQTTSSLRSENVCVLQRGMSIFYSKKLHFYLESIHGGHGSSEFIHGAHSKQSSEFRRNLYGYFLGVASQEILEEIFNKNMACGQKSLWIHGTHGGHGFF